MFNKDLPSSDFQAFDRDTIPQVRRHDFLDIFLVDVGVPDAFRVDDGDRTFLATIKATGRVDPHAALAGQAKLPGAQFRKIPHCFTAATATAWPVRALGTDVGAEENVALVVAHGSEAVLDADGGIGIDVLKTVRHFTVALQRVTDDEVKFADQLRRQRTDGLYIGIQTA